MKKSLIYFLFIFIGCTSAPITENPDLWYDVTGVTMNLLEQMTRLATPVEKVFVLNGQQEAKVYETTDSSFWAVELSSLLSTDLNSPQLRSSIHLEEELTDTSSNLLINRYLPSAEANLFFQKLEIYYLDDPDEIRKIKLSLSSNNIISTNYTNLVLSINRYGKDLLIDSIHVSGYEKTIFQGERKYQSFTRRIRE